MFQSDMVATITPNSLLWFHISLIHLKSVYLHFDHITIKVFEWCPIADS